jgi:hypothetical protein
MFKNVFVTTVIALQGAAFCFAQTPPAENPHKTYDQKARACKKQADDKGLTGEESRAFVAKCMKPAKD